MIRHLLANNRAVLVPRLQFGIINRKQSKEPSPSPKKEPKREGEKLKAIKVSKLKFNEELGGYRIYQIDQRASFLKVSLAMSLGLSVSGLMLFMAPTLANGIPFCMMAGWAVYYQSRLRNTLKEMLVDKTGNNVRVRKYGLFGTDIYGSYTEVPIHILQGVRNKKYKRGLVIVGGGVLDYPRLAIDFNMAGVIDKNVFTAVTAGVPVTYADIL